MMRAKMKVESVRSFEGREDLAMSAVWGDNPFGENGKSEDNTYAKFTPSGSVRLTVNNPDLLGKIKPGQEYYVDFPLAE
jgi:hypothetical protein